MSEAKVREPAEVREMRSQLAAVRRVARGVKESARNLRVLPKSERLTAVTECDTQIYDSLNPPTAPSDDTTKRLR